MSRILLAGTPDFAAKIFKAIFPKYQDQIIGVYTQPDRPKGRGQKIQYSPVKQWAYEKNLPIFQPENFKTPESVQILKNLNPDLILVIAYGLILPQRVLDIPKLGCINVHASLLPKLRGAAPIHQAILQNFKETGITLMQLVREMDAGPSFAQLSCLISPTETTGSLYDKLSILGSKILLENLDSVLNQTLPAIPQDATLATFAPKLNKSDAQINWSESAETIERHIRGCDPWPIAYTTLENSNPDHSIRIYAAQLCPGQTSNKPAGTILDISEKNLFIATGQNQVLNLTQIQMPGKKPVLISEFFHALKNNPILKIGQKFVTKKSEVSR